MFYANDRKMVWRHFQSLQKMHRTWLTDNFCFMKSHPSFLIWIPASSDPMVTSKALRQMLSFEPHWLLHQDQETSVFKLALQRQSTKANGQGQQHHESLQHSQLGDALYNIPSFADSAVFNHWLCPMLPVAFWCVVFSAWQVVQHQM